LDSSPQRLIHQPIWISGANRRPARLPLIGVQKEGIAATCSRMTRRHCGAAHFLDAERKE
jgi:hypothetical protein